MYCPTVSCWQVAPCSAHVQCPSVRCVRVASIQVASVLADVEENLRRIVPLCEEAALKGAKILVLPETCVTGYLGQDQKANWCVKGRLLEQPFRVAKDPANYGECWSGSIMSTFSALAKRLGVYITVPFLEKPELDHCAERQLYYNSVVLVDPGGQTVAHYRKNYPWCGPESTWATAGTALATFDTEYGRVGLAVCYDIHSILSRYAEENIWALLYPIGWVGSGEFWFRTELPRRLQALQVPYYIVGANWSTDEHQEWEGAGWSTIYGPCGTILAATEKTTGSTIVYADLPIEKDTPRKTNSFNSQLYNTHWDDMFGKYNTES